MRLVLAAVAISAMLLAGCAGVARYAGNSGEHFNLGRCNILEPGLFRCPNSEEPLCDPSFARANQVECIKITSNGELIHAQASQ